MRRVGSVLLAVTQRSDGRNKHRAVSQLTVILDILARLDSQALEKLTAQLSVDPAIELNTSPHDVAPE